MVIPALKSILDRIDIKLEDPAAAGRLVRRIESRLELMAETGLHDMGRMGRANNTRERIEHPYIIVCRHDERRDEIVVMSIRHGARRR